MKTIRLLMMSIMMLVSVCAIDAQNKKDFFVGTWNVLVEGTPEGDAHMTLQLKRNIEGDLTGTIAKDKDVIEITNIEKNSDESITIYFNSSDYECYFYVEKTDDDTINGTILDMFAAKGKREKEK